MNDDDLELACIYVVQMGNMVKVGITSDVNRRFATLQTGAPEPLRLRAVEVIGSRDKARRIEKSIHNRLAHRRTVGEWFCIDVEEAMEVTRRATNQAFGIRRSDKGIYFDSVEAMMTWADAVNARAA